MKKQTAGEYNVFLSKSSAKACLEWRYSYLGRRNQHSFANMTAEGW